MKSFVSTSFIGLFILLFIGFFSCKKTKTTTTKVTLTPLQTLVNGDTTMSLFHQMLIEGNDVGLLADDSATLLIPTNIALRAAGYTSDSISNMSSTLADRLIKYQYIESANLVASAQDSSYPTALNVPIFVRKQSPGQLLFNESSTAPDTSIAVGKATVYRLSSLLPGTADSVTEILINDTSLTFLSEAYIRTNFYDSALLTGQYSVLLPSNNAFRAIGYDTVTAVDSIGYDSLVQLLGHQVIKGMYFSTAFPNPGQVTSLTGDAVLTTFNNGVLQFSGAGNTQPVNWLSGNLVTGSNIVVHYTDGFVSP